MTWYPDLDRCDYFRLEDVSSLRAIAWLERGHPFSEGEVDDELLASLFEMAANPWQPVLLLGWHDCSLCDDRDGPGSFSLGERRVTIGIANIFVPDRDVVFVAPSMILHYIAVHQYQPPRQFLEAVKRCPPMGSPQYVEAIVGAGGRGVTRMCKSPRR